MRQAHVAVGVHWHSTKRKNRFLLRSLEVRVGDRRSNSLQLTQLGLRQQDVAIRQLRLRRTAIGASIEERSRASDCEWATIPPGAAIESARLGRGAQSTSTRRRQALMPCSRTTPLALCSTTTTPRGGSHSRPTDVRQASSATASEIKQANRLEHTTHAAQRLSVPATKQSSNQPIDRSSLIEVKENYRGTRVTSWSSHWLYC